MASRHCRDGRTAYNTRPILFRSGSMTATLLRAFAAIFLLIISPALASAQSVRVIARVNGGAITDFDLDKRIAFALKSTGLQDTPEMHQRLAPQILRQMIDERLQIQNADGMGMRTSEAEVNNRIGEIERAGGMAPGTFRAYINSIGVPFEIASQQIEASLAWAKIVRRRVRPTVEVSDSEIDDALNRMRANIGKTEARVGEIFIPIDRPEQAEDSRKAAERVLDQ